MVIDCHVHAAACTPAHGKLSAKLQHSLAFRFMRWRLGMVGDGETLERQIEQKLVDALDCHDRNSTPSVDAGVRRASGTTDGSLDAERTHFYVTNDYVIDLCRHHPKMRFGASVHPFRTDAVAEVRALRGRRGRSC